MRDLFGRFGVWLLGIPAFLWGFRKMDWKYLGFMVLMVFAGIALRVVFDFFSGGLSPVEVFK